MPQGVEQSNPVRRYSDFAPPTGLDVVPRAERTHLEPLLPLGGVPLTPTSECPHYCKTCSRSGSLVFVATGESFPCPDCGGTGRSKPDAPFVCLVCDRSGKDGLSPALPLFVKPLPADNRKYEPGKLKGGR